MTDRQHINTIRGVACLLLVLYHVIGEPYKGLQITEGLLRDMNDFLAYIRMPLFTFLSGYVYAIRPYQSGAGRYIAGKARRLLIPMLVVGTAFAVIQAVVPGTNASIQNWYTLHIYPYAHYWFIESLFLIFLAILALEASGLMKGLYRFTAVFAGAVFLYLFVFGTRLFSLSGSIYLMPFFLAGLACYRFGLVRKIPVGAILLIFALSLLILIWENYAGKATRRSAVALLFGTTSCILLLRSSISWKPLATIGVYSYSIYLFHVFFTASSRIALEATGTSNLLAYVVIGCSLGIAGPMVIESIAVKNRFTATLLLGKRWGNGSPTQAEPTHDKATAL